MRSGSTRSPVFPALVAFVLASGAACSSPSSDHVAQLTNGAVCTAGGQASCVSGHCDNGFCCDSGNCCSVADDCPAAFRAAPTCSDATSTTTCQGTRRDAACQNFICATLTVPDDSACAGAARDCGAYKAIACTSDVTQPEAACPTTCASNGDCAPGYGCDASSHCVAAVGTGAACSGTGQGTCQAGLKCENGVCCDAAGATCCTSAAQCTNGLACDAATSACFTTCTNFDTSRCAAAGTFCASNVCVAKFPVGTGCSTSSQCALGNCVNGVCCDSACNGTCQACAANGHCGTAPDGTTCSDANACTYGQTCTGGTCGGGATATCTPGVCNGGCNGAGGCICDPTGWTSRSSCSCGPAGNGFIDCYCNGCQRVCDACSCL